MIKLSKEDLNGLSKKEVYKKGIKNFPRMPQVGDIIKGEVSSMQPYDSLYIHINIAKIGASNIFGYIYKPNLNKHHPFSIANAQLERKGLILSKRILTVEVVNCTEKGYELKEVLDEFDVSFAQINKSTCQTVNYSIVEDFSIQGEENLQITQMKPVQKKL